MNLFFRLVPMILIALIWAVLPEAALALQAGGAENAGMPTAEFDEGSGSWAIWIGAVVIGVFGLALVFLIRRFSLGSRQRPVDTDKSAANNKD